MLQYLAKRFLIMIPTFFGIVVVSFLIIKLAPGDPASQKFGGAGQASAGMDAMKGTQAAEARFREKYHLDDPLHVQFWHFLKRLTNPKDEFVFYQNEKPIWGELFAALWVTVRINLIVFFLIYLIAIPTGIYSAAFPHSWGDKTSTIVLFMLYSLPSFWAAEMLRDFFSGTLPIANLYSDNWDSLGPWERFWDAVRHLIMPVLCLTYGGLAYISRQMRAGMLEVVQQDYIRTARAKGAGEARVILVHALRNGLFPIITLFASLLPFLVGGSVIIERIFNIRGMGWWSIEWVFRREYEAVMATLMLSTFMTLLGILISDVMYVLVNPQVKFDDKS